MKILVLQLKRIGDLILTAPALLALRESLPEARITLAIEDGCRELLPALDFVNDTLVCNRKEGNAPLWWRMAFSQFDVCLDFTGNDRSALFSVLSKAPKRAAFQATQKSAMRSILYNCFVDSPVRERHTADHYLDLLRALNIEARGGERIPLRLPDWAFKKAQQLLEAKGITAPYIIIHPGSARSEKYWVAKRWARVIDFCNREAGFPCVLTGGPDSVERDHIEKIKAALQTPCHDLSGTLDLMTLAALAKNAWLFLSVDSAAMHLAGASGTPQIALFGPTNPFHWRPRHDRAIILTPGRMEPLTEFKPQYLAAPLNEISTNQVTHAVKTLLLKRQSGVA